MMNVVFRVDASIQIGTGHVMRCLTLATRLREHDLACEFVCRDHSGNMIEAIRAKGFAAHVLPSADALESIRANEEPPRHAPWLGASWQIDAAQTLALLAGEPVEWLVVDHYALDARWERTLRPAARRVMVIDDLADRKHDCDVLLDQNLGRTRSDYTELVNAGAVVLTGPMHALLRPEFTRERAHSLQRRSAGRSGTHILLSLGGVDKDNCTSGVLHALRQCRLPADTRITVVMGSCAPWLEAVRQAAAAMPWPTELLVDVTDMASVMGSADIAIGAAGGTAWERCCVALPTLLVLQAENQEAGAHALAARGAAIVLGHLPSAVSKMPQVVPEVLRPATLKSLSDAAAAVCDGGGTQRVCAVLRWRSGAGVAVRAAAASDAELLFAWANEPTARANAINVLPIPWESHVQWLGRKLEQPEQSLILIGMLAGVTPCGQVRFDREENGEWLIDYSLAPEFRGMGLGVALLRSALTALAQRDPRAVAGGVVKLGNGPSRRVFEVLGFQRITAPDSSMAMFRRSAREIAKS